MEGGKKNPVKERSSYLRQIIKGSREILLQQRAQQEMGHSERKTKRGYAGTGWQRSLHN